MKKFMSILFLSCSILMFNSLSSAIIDFDQSTDTVPENFDPEMVLGVLDTTFINDFGMKQTASSIAEIKGLVSKGYEVDTSDGHHYYLTRGLKGGGFLSHLVKCTASAGVTLMLIPVAGPAAGIPFWYYSSKAWMDFFDECHPPKQKRSSISWIRSHHVVKKTEKSASTSTKAAAPATKSAKMDDKAASSSGASTPTSSASSFCSADEDEEKSVGAVGSGGLGAVQLKKDLEVANSKLKKTQEQLNATRVALKASQEKAAARQADDQADAAKIKTTLNGLKDAEGRITFMSTAVENLEEDGAQHIQMCYKIKAFDFDMTENMITFKVKGRARFFDGMNPQLGRFKFNDWKHNIQNFDVDVTPDDPANEIFNKMAHEIKRMLTLAILEKLASGVNNLETASNLALSASRSESDSDASGDLDTLAESAVMVEPVAAVESVGSSSDSDADGELNPLMNSATLVEAVGSSSDSDESVDGFVFWAGGH